MKIVHWLFLVSVALFVSGIGFVIAGARAARAAPAAEAGPALTPVASVKQIMNAIVGPAASAVFESVSTTVSFAGIDEKQPRSDAEWESVGNSAAALIESGNLMLMGSRVVDKDDWVRMAQALVDAGKLTLEATRAQNAEQLLAAGEKVNISCDDCHRKYQRGS